MVIAWRLNNLIVVRLFPWIIERSLLHLRCIHDSEELPEDQFLEFKELLAFGVSAARLFLPQLDLPLGHDVAEHRRGVLDAGGFACHG